MLPSIFSDVEICSAPVSPALENMTARGVLWQAAPNRFLLEVPNVARYLVEDGHCLTIDSAPAANEETIARFARTVPLAALAYQRGMLAFHAAAVVPTGEPDPVSSDPPAPRSSILLAGDSGVGKSVLLAALLQTGWKILSDEIAIVGLDESGAPVVFPVHPEFMLWNNALEKLKLQDMTGFSSDLNSLENGRRIFSAENNFWNTPCALKYIYWLTTSNEGETEKQAVRGINFFQGINMLLYNSHIADAVLERGAHFRITSAITQNATLHKLDRQRGTWNLEKLLDACKSPAGLGNTTT